MKYLILFIFLVQNAWAADYDQPKQNATTDELTKYSREAWCGGMFNIYKVDDVNFLVLHMTRTSGINSSELYVYRAINIQFWQQISHLPLVANATRKVEVVGGDIVVRQINNQGEVTLSQVIKVK